MRVFLDTNIILDVALARAPHFDTSSVVMSWCCDHSESTSIAWHSFTNIYYILSRLKSSDEARAFLSDLLPWVELAPVSKFFLHQSLITEGDVEDVLQYLCAEAGSADVIVTRDPDGFQDSPVRALSPEAFIQEVK